MLLDEITDMKIVTDVFVQNVIMRISEGIHKIENTTDLVETLSRGE